jgi:subtilase family serine protease
VVAPARGTTAARAQADTGARVRHPLIVRLPPAGSLAITGVVGTTPFGYTPAQMRRYLGLTGDGAGQTIAITNAYHAPHIREDARAFSETFGLPPPCDDTEQRGRRPPAPDCFPLIVAIPQGLPPVDAGWALEASLDVEWAHAIAPRASILLVEGIVDDLDPMMAAIDYAAKQGADVISNSWYTEESPDESRYDSHCRLHRAVCVFASGDDGYPATYPAVSPYVIGVGGTTLTLADDGSVISETAWSRSGGGASLYESRPLYQDGAHALPSRGTPDVSYDGDIRTGFPIYSTLGIGAVTGWLQVGGTSAGAPQWAAIIAIADQLRKERHLQPLAAFNGSAQAALYGEAVRPTLYDVVAGSNGFCGTACAAAPGSDFVTGLGSPRAGIDVALADAGRLTGPPPR